MILPPVGVRVLIATRPVDFRRGADGLAATVQTMLRQDPICGAVFVFRSKRAQPVSLCPLLVRCLAGDQLIVLVILIYFWPPCDHALHP